MSKDENNPSWIEWSRYVLEELKRLNAKMEKVDEDLRDLKIEIMMLKIKASAWGSVAGAVATSIGFIVNALLSK